MKLLEPLFFELIRVAIGTQAALSRIPNTGEWGALYYMAQAQSLLGICFASLQKLGADADTGFTRIGMSEMLYMTWMGRAAKILQKNEVVNQQCVELQSKLSADGFKNCILKGQGVATLYGDYLQGFRQSGDIDVLMWKEGMSFHKNKQAVIAYAQNIGSTTRGAEHHIGVHLFDDAEVEMHYAPAYFCNPFANKRFRRWFECEREKLVKADGFDFYRPSTEYNIVFLLAHTFRHYMSEGVGLRQIMDYFFVLKTFSISPIKVEELRNTLSSLNMLKFAGAVMWVMKEVFRLSDQFIIFEPNERLGQKLLAHVMQGGNFGHHNTKTVARKNSHVGRFMNQLVHDMKLALDYPGEALWAPLSMIREFVRIRI